MPRSTGYASQKFLGSVRGGIKAGKTPKEAVKEAYAKKVQADAKKGKK